MAPGKVWLSVVLVAMATVPHAAIGQTGPLPTTGPAISDVPQQSAVLASSDSSPQQRDEAARRLVARHTSDAIAALRAALSDLRSQEGQLAAARALAGDADPDPALVDPLFALLPTANRPLNRTESELASAAGGALAMYKGRPEVVVRLSELARSKAPESVRSAAIDALGHMVDKQAAETLVRLVGSEDESDRIRTAAADALANLTGLTENAADPAAWAKWWQANNAKSAIDFRIDVLLSRAQRLDLLQQRHHQLADETSRELTAQYQAAAQAVRDEMLLRLLASPAAELRVLGVDRLLSDKAEGRPITDAAMARLRQMVSDNDWEVRLNAAVALAQLNDKDAFEPLLAQLKQERDPRVRARLARALGPIGDIRAVPVLIDLLNDPFVEVAIAAADSIRDLGAKLHQADPAMATKAAAALRPLLARPTRSEKLRTSAAFAIAELRVAEMLPVLRELLGRNESSDMHRAAIIGIGQLGIRDTASLILPFLNAEETVQIEAIRQLGNLKAVEAVDPLAQLTSSNESSIASAAWDALAGMLPMMSEQQLIGLEGTFDQRKQWDRKIVVLQQEADNYKAHNNGDEQANKMHQIAGAQVELKRYAEAADNFGKALDLKQAQPAPAAEVILRLVIGRLNALLRAGNYQDAIDFAQQQIKRDPALRDDVGREIKSEAERLTGAPGQPIPAAQAAQALDLIERAKKMDPAPSPRFVNMLDDLAQDIRQRQTGNKP